MMDQKTAMNTIRNILMEGVDVDQIVEDMYWVFAVESWPYDSHQFVFIEDLTDEQYRLVTSWYFYNRDRYVTKAGGFRSLNFQADMAEMFPGLAEESIERIVQ